MSNLLIALFWTFITILIYYLSAKLYKRVRSPFLLPVLLSTAIIIVILLITRISYDTYMLGGEWISKLLGPAVVALAYPLYQQREILKRLTTPILIGTAFGSFIGVTSGVLLAKLAGFDKLIIAALSPKSVTTPVAMAITDSLGGPTPLAAVFVMIAGIGGVMISPFIFKLFRLNNFVGRGVGIGSASHAIGTVSAMENGQLEGSISTIAMVVSAVIVSIITPGLITLLM